MDYTETITILIAIAHINSGIYIILITGVLPIQLDRKEELINDYSKAIEINKIQW